MYGDAHERDAKLLYQLEMIVFFAGSHLKLIALGYWWSRGSTVKVYSR